MSTALADPQILTHRVREMVGAGRLVAARPLLAALRSMGVAPDELAELEGRLLLREGRIAEALTLLDTALDRSSQPALHLCRAEARMAADDAAGAAADAAEAVVAARHDPEAKALLGIALIGLGRADEALPCLRAAIAARPRELAWRQALAAGLERTGERAAAAATLAEAIELAPTHCGLRTAAIMLAMRARDFEGAAAAAEAARRAGAADACVFGLAGHALSSLGRHAEAAEAYAEALKLAPEDVYVRHLVSASGALPQALRAPPEYLETVFDGYASRFEQHLIGLGYRVPGLIRAALLAELPAGAPIGPVLDLGCGTGLIGVVLSDLELRGLVGVDLSGAMLAEARGKGLYQRLAREDIEVFLAAPGEAWPVIVAADVFCYFGALDRVLAAAAARLAPGGLFVFTVERDEAVGGDEASAAKGWRLARQGRYCHRESGVRAALAAAGLEAVRLAPEVLRYEADTPVDGLLVVARRAG